MLTEESFPKMWQFFKQLPRSLFRLNRLLTA